MAGGKKVARRSKRKCVRLRPEATSDEGFDRMVDRLSALLGGLDRSQAAGLLLRMGRPAA